MTQGAAGVKIGIEGTAGGGGLSNMVELAGGTASGTAEQELIERSRRGDRVAFDSLVAMHEKAAFSLARWFLEDYHDALDVAQEAFVRAYLGISRFRGGSTFRTWLYSILLNLARNRIKARGRQRLRYATLTVEEDDPDGPRERQIASGNPGPDARLEQAELRVQIEGAIARLPPEQREIVLLRDVEGLSYDEVALAAGCSVGTVKSRLHRARSELREYLRGVMEDEMRIGP